MGMQSYIVAVTQRGANYRNQAVKVIVTTLLSLESCVGEGGWAERIATNTRYTCDVVRGQSASRRILYAFVRREKDPDLSPSVHRSSKHPSCAFTGGASLRVANRCLFTPLRRANVIPRW